MSAALRNDFRSRSDSPVVLPENTITGSPSKNGSAVRHPPAPNRACRAATGRQSPIKLWLPDGPSHIEDLERILAAPRALYVSAQTLFIEHIAHQQQIVPAVLDQQDTALLLTGNCDTWALSSVSYQEH